MKALHLRFETVKDGSITVEKLSNAIKQMMGDSIYGEEHVNFWSRQSALCAYIKYDTPKKKGGLVDGDIYCPFSTEDPENIFSDANMHLTFPDGGYVYPENYGFIDEATLIKDGYHRFSKEN